MPQTMPLDIDRLADAIAERLGERIGKGTKPVSDLLTLEHGAAHCNTSLSNFKLWAEAGYFPKVKRGRYVRFRRADLDAFLDRQVLRTVREPRQRLRKRRMVRGEVHKTPSPLLR